MKRINKAAYNNKIIIMWEHEGSVFETVGANISECYQLAWRMTR